MLGQNVTPKKKDIGRAISQIDCERKPVHLALCAMIKGVSAEASYIPSEPTKAHVALFLRKFKRSLPPVIPRVAACGSSVVLGSGQGQKSGGLNANSGSDPASGELHL